VALLCPDRAALSRLSAKLGKTGSVEELVADKYVTTFVFKGTVAQDYVCLNHGTNRLVFDMPYFVSTFSYSYTDFAKLF
jgi:hypothetical protein